MAPPIAPDQKIFATVRAWFPAPEFKVDTLRDPNTFGLLYRIMHVASRLTMTGVFDDDAGLHQDMIDHGMNSTAVKMHHQLAMHGYGEPMPFYGFYDMRTSPWTRHDPKLEFEAKQALLNLFDMKLLQREVQGIGHQYYIVKLKEWAYPVTAEALDRPLEWWQSLVSTLLKGPVAI